MRLLPFALVAFAGLAGLPGRPGLAAPGVPHPAGALAQTQGSAPHLGRSGVAPILRVGGGDELRFDHQLVGSRLVGDPWLPLPQGAAVATNVGDDGSLAPAAAVDLRRHLAFGSNQRRLVLGAEGTALPGAGRFGLGASASGPIVHDRAWAALHAEHHSGQLAPVVPGGAARAFGKTHLASKLTWQVNPRLKLTSLGAFAADETAADERAPVAAAPDPAGGHRRTRAFAGVAVETLLADNLFVVARAGYDHERLRCDPHPLAPWPCAARPEPRETQHRLTGPRFQLVSEWFPSARTFGQHHVSTGVEAAFAHARAWSSAASAVSLEGAAAAEDARADTSRSKTRFAETSVWARDVVRPVRCLSITAGVTARTLRFAGEPAAPVFAAVGFDLGAVWDVGGQGHTIVRARRARQPNPGALWAWRADGEALRARLPSIGTTSVGVEHALLNELAAGIELFESRRDAFAADGRDAFTVRGATATLVQREGPTRLVAAVTALASPTPGLAGSADVAVRPWRLAWLAASAARGPALAASRLRDEHVEAHVGPLPGPLTGGPFVTRVALRIGLSPPDILGAPTQAFLDVYDLTVSRSRPDVPSPGSTSVTRLPPPGVRLSLRVAL